jgi:hypothetical protein
LKSVEPNLLLALSTGLALALLVATASLFGEPGQTLKYVVIALLCPVLFVVANGWWKKRSGAVTTAMVHRDAPATAVWASIFPAVMMLGAAIPVFFPGPDYGILVVIASVWFGATLESAIKARQN